MNLKYEISIIVVNYNGKKYLKNFFEALMQLSENSPSFEVVFVDNASTDDSVSYIRDQGWDQILSLKIIENKENQGFAGGNNTGVKAAEGKYVVFLNNDTAVQPEWLFELHRCISTDSACGMAVGKLQYFYSFIYLQFRCLNQIKIERNLTVNGERYRLEGKYCFNLITEAEQLSCGSWSSIALPLLTGERRYRFKLTINEYTPGDAVLIAGREIPITQRQMEIDLDPEEVVWAEYRMIQNAGSGINSHFDGYDIGAGEPDHGQYDTERELEAGCGASMMLQKDLFTELGGFDERFFMYYEDTDLSFRLRKKGLKIRYCPKAVVRHIHTGSSGEWSPFFTYHVYRNRLAFIFKNISIKQFLIQASLQFASGCKHRDFMRIKTIFAAVVLLCKPRKCYK